MSQGAKSAVRRVVALTLAGLGLAVSSQAYVVKENGTPGTANFRDRARAVVVGPTGTVVAAGSIEAGPGNIDAVLRQYGGRDGARGWSMQLAGGAGLDDEFLKMKVDGSGNVAAAGSIHNPGTFDDLSVILLAADGSLRWHRAFDGAYASNDAGDDEDIADALAFDAAGDVIAGGRLDNRGNFGDAAILKLAAADGHEIWRRVMDEEGNGLVYDLLPTGGNVYAAAVIARPLNDGVVLKLSGQDGSILWRRNFEGSGGGRDERILSLALHPSGDVIAAGALDNGLASGRDAVIARLRASDGAIVWQRVLDWPGGDDYNPGEEAQEVAVDAAGNVYAAGYVMGETGADLFAVSLDGDTGADRWARAVDGGAGVTDIAFALAVTTDGGIIAGGFLNAGGGSVRDAAIFRFSATDGSETWRATFPGVEGASIGFVDVALDRLNNPVAAGGLVGEPGDLSDFAVVKLSALTGADFADTDGDGLSDPDEVLLGTDPAAQDTDHDGMGDGDEVDAGTSPTNPDSDGDGIPDGAESVHGLVQGAPESALHSGGARTAFLSRLDTIFAAIAAGDTGGAIDQLQNLRRWVDGCEATPPAPDRDDKVVDCTLQDQIRAEIDRLLATLGG